MGPDFLRIARNADDRARVTRPVDASGGTRLARTDSRQRPAQVLVPSAGPLMAAGTAYTTAPPARTDGPLTPAEVKEARRVFGTALNTDDIFVSESRLMSVGGYARTLPQHIYLGAALLKGLLTSSFAG